MAWKVVERSCVVFGAIFSGVCAYYAAAGYYGWNVARPLGAPADVTSVTLPWPFLIGGALGVALMATAWAMMLTRRRANVAKREQVSAVQNPTEAPPVKGLSPLRSIEEFADKPLVQAALNALNTANAANEEKSANYREKSAYQAILDDQILEKKSENADLAFYIARQRVLDNLITQLKQQTLVGRALPFDDKKLVSDRDWEYIKASHCSVLKFDTSDKTLETITGGGRTYKGLQIGRPSSVQS